MRLYAEWEHQEFVQLMFPHKDSDWYDILYEILPIFEQIAMTIAKYQNVLVCYKNQSDIKNIKSYNNTNIFFKQVDSNDTWCRDFGAISLKSDDQSKLFDFIFDGWGNKFEAQLDNKITSTIFKKDYIRKIDFVLEGGSIESNSKKTVLTTKNCILNLNRNNTLSSDKKLQYLKKYLNTDDIIVLNYGSLLGDDTDSHIDMLARFVDDETIVYTTAFEDDENYVSLNNLEKELQSLNRFNLVPLPQIPKIYHNNSRLPTSYANFLIINDAVLLPIYGDEVQDNKAISLFKNIFKDKIIEPIDCSKIVIQGGSLHCLSMQYYLRLNNLLN